MVTATETRQHESSAQAARKLLPQSDDEIDLDLTSSDGDSRDGKLPQKMADAKVSGCSSSMQHDLNSSGISHASEPPSASNTPSTSCERGKVQLPPRHPRASHGSAASAANSSTVTSNTKFRGKGGNGSGNAPSPVSIQLPTASTLVQAASAERYFIGSPRDTYNSTSSNLQGYGWEMEPPPYPPGSIASTMIMRVFREFLQLMWELADIFFDGVARTKLVIREGPARLAGQNGAARNLEKVGFRMVVVRCLCVLAVMFETFSRMGRSVGGFIAAAARQMDAD